MSTFSGPRQTAFKLPESVRQRLNRLAITTVAAVTLLALTWPVEAKVIYTPVNVTVSGNGSIKLDLNQDGIVDFTVEVVTDSGNCSPIGHYAVASVTLTPAKNNGVVAISGDASVLGKGAKIDSSQSFQEAQAPMAHEVSESGPPPCHFTGYGGYWCDGFAAGPRCHTVNGYLGLEFEVKGSIYYGWAHMIITPGSNWTFVAELKGFAYETVPGEAIKAGQTSGDADDPAVNPDSANPEDSGPGASLTYPTPSVRLDYQATWM